MNNSFSSLLNLYLTNYLVIQRNMSSNTIRSYKCTFKSLIKYITDVKNIPIKNINFGVINRDTIIDFLDYIENETNASIRTRNQRLAVIKSFYSYVKDTNPEQLINIQQILTIKCKKEIKKEFDYLTKEEVDKFLNSIPTDFNKGIRDYTLLMLLYDSGARAQEIVNLKVEDLRLDSDPVVRLFGKGNKYRTVPITNSTKKILIRYIDINKFDNNSVLFPNPKGNYATTKMITHIIDKYSSILNKNIHPHTFRHSRAMHLLEAGVNLIYIRDFLGHNSIETTEIYAKANDNIKRQAITNAYNFDISKNLNDWNEDENLLKELLNI